MRGLIWLFGLPVLMLTILGQKEAPPTFARDIRPILVKKCVSCHSEGGLGPFALQTYDQTRKRGDLVRQVVLTGQMPPTDARSDYGEFSPHQLLTSAELRVIQEWFRLGMPQGEKTSPLPGKPKQTPFETDHVVRYSVGKGQIFPAEGRSARVVYPIAQPTGGLGYLHHFSFQPDGPKAVRQVILAIQKPGQPTPFTASGIVPGTPAVAWGEGFNTWQSSPGYLTVDKADRLWLQIKAVPTGKIEPASGLVTIARRFQPDKVETRTLGHTDINVDSDAQKTLRSEWVLDRDIDLLSVIPEARFTTEQLKVTATLDGETKTVMMVLTWDPIWPGAYNFLKPIRLKKGTTLAYEAYVNNSKHGHAAEEEKPKPLKFGPNPQDELFWCHLTYIPR